MPVDELEDPLDFSLLKPMEGDDEDHCPDFREPSTVLFELQPPCTLENGNRIGWAVEVWAHEGGCAAYENCYGGFLDYTVRDLAEGFMDDPLREKDAEDDPRGGVYVLEGMTSEFYRGDGWTSDDNMEFEAEDLRRATLEEIAEAWNGADFWASDPYDNVA